MSLANLNLITNGESDGRFEYGARQLSSAISDDPKKITAEFPHAPSIFINKLFEKSSDLKFISVKYQEDILAKSDSVGVKRTSCTIVEQWLKYGISVVAINDKYINVIELADIAIYRLRFPVEEISSSDYTELQSVKFRFGEEDYFIFTTDKLVFSILEFAEIKIVSFIPPSWDYDGSIKGFESMVSYSLNVLQLINSHRECILKRDVLNSNAFVMVTRKSKPVDDDDFDPKTYPIKAAAMGKQFVKNDNFNMASENAYIDAEHVSQMAPYIVGEESRQTLRGLQRELYAHFNFPAFFGGSENRERAASSQIQVEFQIQRYHRTIKTMGSILQEFWKGLGIKFETIRPIVQPSVIKTLVDILSPEESRELISNWVQGL